MKKQVVSFRIKSLIVLTALIMGIGFGVWQWKQDSKNSELPISGVNSAAVKQPEMGVSDQEALRIASQENKGVCSSGRIIVYFNQGVSIARQQEVISAEKVTIKNELDQFNGYILNVPVGDEVTKAAVFSKYPEVKSASPEGCPDSTSTPDAVN